MSTIVLTRGKTLPDTGVKSDLHDLVDLTTAAISNIVNADVSASAAIAGSKIDPNFGAQDIETTGDVSAGDVSAADGTFNGTLDVTGYGGKSIQVVNTITGAVATGTTTMPQDDTIPQITEGDEYMTLAITPTSATNYLKITVVCNVSPGSAAAKTSCALFQDSTANAIASVNGEDDSANIINFVFTHWMVAGTTSATTFKVRAGYASAGTTTFNGRSSGRIHGGVMASSITIEEIGTVS